ncbi:hypothetical protein J4429_02310 [Candidatus Pacearchaeota archaeon]|nr:hypothetical protein [Candidatus Pacearchaeota archaeon]
MTTIEEHKEIAKEFLDDINEKIRANLLLERQKIIGFAASESATNLFAVFLHSKNLIEPSFSINHRFFASLRIAERKFNFNFPKKEELLKLLVKQEDFRNKICYGKKKDLEIVNNAIKNLFEIKKITDIELEVKNE